MEVEEGGAGGGQQELPPVRQELVHLGDDTAPPNLSADGGGLSQAPLGLLPGHGQPCGDEQLEDWSEDREDGALPCRDGVLELALTSCNAPRAGQTSPPTSVPPL